MNKIVGVAFILALGCLQLEALSKHQLSESELRGFIDKVKELWEKLKTVVKEAIDKAEAKIEEAWEKLKSKAEEWIHKGKEQINKIIDSLLGELEELKEKAKEAGVDIKDCTKDNEPALKQLGINLLYDLTTCITDQVDAGETIVTNIINEFKETYNNVVDYGRQIEECSNLALQRTLDNEFTCITKLIAKITLEIAELPLSIANDVLKAIELVEGLSTSLETCATVQVARASAEGAGILAEITKCVNDKINV